jgi:sugar lactone lactonase YvrE
MTVRQWGIFVALIVSLPAEAVAGQGVSVAQAKGGVDESGEYEPVRNWPQPVHDDWTWGRTAGVWAESPNRIFVLQTGELARLEQPIRGDGRPQRAAASVRSEHRREHILMVFDANGQLIDSWEQHNHLFSLSPHSLKISPYDPERHLWILDTGMDQIFKFTQQGELVLTLGEPEVPASDETHFGGPSDIAFLPNGDFLISDGYKNSRIVRYSEEGNYLTEWGKRGDDRGEFRTPHSIAIDAEQRIYVADRGNSRIQVFDSNGRFLDMWPNIPFPLSIAVSKDQHLWVSDGRSHKFLKYDLDGKLLYSFGTFGGRPGQIWGVHQFSVDTEGNLYTAEVWGGRAQKFRPKRGADPAKQIGPLYVAPSSR